MTHRMASESKCLPSRPLYLLFLVDCSSSVRERAVISALNLTMRKAMHALREMAQKNPRIQFLVQVMKFSDRAEWDVAVPTPIEEFAWSDLEFEGHGRNLGEALRMVAAVLHSPPMPERALRPVICLCSLRPWVDWVTVLSLLVVSLP